MDKSAALVILFFRKCMLATTTILLVELKLYPLLRNSKFTEVIILNSHMAREPIRWLELLTSQDKTAIFAYFVNEPSR